jgi:hypothetical protein
MSSWALLALTLAALLPSSSLCWAGIENAHIARAFRNSDGRLLVVFGPESMFWGSSQELHQLETTAVPTTDSEAADDASSFTFFRGLARARAPAIKELNGDIVIDTKGARVACSGANSAAYVPLSVAEQTALESQIRSGSTRLRALPRVLEPVYLFEAPGTEKNPGELVLVQSPIFNFRGDFHVSLGSETRLRPIAVRTDPEGQTESHRGRIEFASGGGLYIPLTIDFLGREGNRGSPTLIRGHGDSIEALRRPHLSRRKLEALGFGKPIFARLFTPCDPGRLARVGPRF